MNNLKFERLAVGEDTQPISGVVTFEPIEGLLPRFAAEIGLSVSGELYVRTWHVITGKELRLKADLRENLQDAIVEHIKTFDREEYEATHGAPPNYENALLVQHEALTRIRKALGSADKFMTPAEIAERCESLLAKK